MNNVRIVLNLFIDTGDIEYTLGYINLNNINTVQELFDIIYNLPDLYNGYIFLLDFNVTQTLKSYSTNSELIMFKNAFVEDNNNYIYVRTIFEFLDSNPQYKNKHFLSKWFDSDNKIKDTILYTNVNYGKGL